MCETHTVGDPNTPVPGAIKYTSSRCDGCEPINPNGWERPQGPVPQGTIGYIAQGATGRWCVVPRGRAG